MERSAAINKLGKLLGKTMGYRVDPKAPSPAEREEAQAAVKPVRAELDVLVEKREARMKEILAADAEYQKLKADSTTVRERLNRLVSTACHYKFTVGTTSSLFFHVLAQGDSWEQVIAKVEGDKRKKEVA